MNFLCRHLTPEPEQAAWGCRAIFRPGDRWVLVMNERIRELALDGREADGYVREGEPVNFLCRHLTPEPEQAAWGCRAIFRPGDRWVLDIVPDRVDMLWTDELVNVVCSPQGSYGYLYVTAVLKG